MKKIFTSILLVILTVGIVKAQSVYQPYSYQFYQKLDEDVYSTKTRVHSSLKPFFVDDSLIQHHYDSLMNGVGGFKGKFFTDHQIDVKGSNSTFYADLLPDFNISRDFSGKKNTSFGSLGLQFGGTVGKQFSYYVAGYENRAQLPEYLATYTNQTGIARGQAYAGLYGTEYRWSYITAVASYTPNKYLNISAGRDKTFIGDGYRSELLSDYSSPYPFFKVTATLGSVRYMAMWAYMDDPLTARVDNSDRKKFGVFHYLDWNVSNRLSFGFFDSIIWPEKDDAGHYRGFEYTYLNPLIFLRPLEASNGSPDNALIGFTGKYKISDGVTAYGQFMLDEFESSSFFSNKGSSRNKYGFQLGLRGPNLFGVKGLNYLLETNNVKPYTYSERGSIENYANNGEPLAHPWGANFREAVALLNYSYKRFDFSGEVDYGHYGLDINGQNFGKDLYQLYIDPSRQYGNYTGQGLTTNMVFLEGKVAYLLNPKYNLRIELGGLYRTEKNAQFNDKTAMLSFGIRSSFRSMYNDIASYKVH
ncbi:gliding motility protein RemB [Mucilaginibacter flavus]|uniref:gliding motility protein RemB n=1 Tax=Mucilaginibacter flavus TaxID=931504 RepID=UPI0025B5527C|nr:gliding motility protein RemB [Mucilaginibacter flavus]MDN3581135.1 gliding motility protein RemB [Mucilaginibacter flavus]